MSTAAFDTHAAVKRLQEAGADERLAEAVVATVHVAVGEPVTRTDLDAALAPLATKADVANEFKASYRHLWVMAAGIVGVTVVLVKLIP